MLASVMTAKSLRTSALRARAARAKEQADRDARAQEKLAAGFAGQRLGRHKVPTGEIDVQLGEDLSESLRALKVGRFLTRLSWEFGQELMGMTAGGQRLPRPDAVAPAARADGDPRTRRVCPPRCALLYVR
jgi:hypothetical protein